MGKRRIRIVTVVLLVALLSVFYFVNNSTGEAMTLKVAFPYKRPIDAYEPTKIHLAPEYVLLENIYSPLVELSKDNGTPLAGVAESFQWKDGQLHLVIRNDLKTIDGHSINAKDVVFSLKRLLVLSENTHGNFKDIICPGKTLKTVDTECSAISLRGNTVIIAPPDGEKAFLVPMLASIDFAILPRASVDPKTLKITDYRNTSGPYYVDSDDGNGNIKLKAKKSHYNYSPNIPQEIILVPSGIEGTSDSITLFEQGKVDFITTIDKLNPEKIISYAKKSGHTLHSTTNIRTFLLFFTPKGLKKYSLQERLVIGKKMKKIFHHHYKNIHGYEKTNQFFPALGDGSLDEKESKLIDSIYKGVENKEIKGLKLSIVRLGKIQQYEKALREEFEDIDVSEGKNIPAFSKYDNEAEIPDCLIGGPDTGFIEDIGLISYSMYAGFFGIERKESSRWLARYMKISDKSKRLEKLKELHFQSLKNAIIIPLVSAPYVALARRPWEIKLSRLYANNPLWPIVKK